MDRYWSQQEKPLGRTSPPYRATQRRNSRSGRKFSNWEKTVRPWFTHHCRPRRAGLWALSPFKSRQAKSPYNPMHRRDLSIGQMPLAGHLVIRDDPMPALVALLHILHMAAKGGRAAVANRLESFSLLRTEHMSPLREEIAFVFAEDIGHFEPILAHGFREVVCAGSSRLRESSSSIGLLVERTVLSARCR